MSSSTLPPGLQDVLESNPSFLAAYKANTAEFLTVFLEQQNKALALTSTAQGHTAQLRPTFSTYIPPQPAPVQQQIPTTTFTFNKSFEREDKGLRFTFEEDERLCRCWLRITEDPIVGTQQKLDAFWKRVTDLFNSELVGPSLRAQKALSNRWQKIARCVNVFVGCYRRASSLRPSGEDTEWAMKQAHTFYKEKDRVAFNFLHCWQILKTCPK